MITAISNSSQDSKIGIFSPSFDNMPPTFATQSSNYWCYMMLQNTGMMMIQQQNSTKLLHDSELFLESTRNPIFYNTPQISSIYPRNLKFKIPYIPITSYIDLIETWNRVRSADFLTSLFRRLDKVLFLDLCIKGVCSGDGLGFVSVPVEHDCGCQGFVGFPRTNHDLPATMPYQDLSRLIKIGLIKPGSLTR